MICMKDIITILHVFPEEKFFDPVSETYDIMEGVHNLYYLYTIDKDYTFRYVKHTEKIVLIHDEKEYVKLFSRNDIDIILFHSLKGRYFKYFNYIDRRKIVIWWSWGGDIYNTLFNDVSPLISWENYKPLTKQYIKDHVQKNTNQEVLLKKWLRSFWHKYLIWRVVKRIDYFIPCIPIDYEMLKQHCRYFHAKLMPNFRNIRQISFVFHEQPGNVLIGNSLTYTNNHLDVFEKVRTFSLTGERKYIIPVSYGWGQAFGNNPDNLIALSSLNQDSVLWLKDYMDREDYFKIFNKVTHAILGVMRQQALGNIFYCLRTGVKVYLYKDSIVAKQMRKEGYVFFTIEDDLTEASLSECLGKEQAMHNFMLEQKKYDGESFIAMNKMFHQICNKI